jgi:uncharacterized membrane protein YdbT with pleckstrin-like domain
MSDRPAETALREALTDWRRNLAALAVVALMFGVAALTSSAGIRYGAGLIAFTVWMAWFVLTAIDWIRRAEF